MALGVLLSIISFVVVYAKLSSLTSSSSHLLLRSSTVVRSYEERRALLCKANRGKIVTISLKGYVFFGSAVKILEEVKSRVILTPSATDSSPLSFSCTEGRMGSDETSESNGDNSTHIQCQAPMFSFQMNRGNASEKKNSGIAHSVETLGSAKEKEKEQTKAATITKERDAFSQRKAHEMASYVPMASSSSSDSAHRRSSTRESEFKSVNSLNLTSYSPLQMMSAKSRGDDRSQSYNTISHFAPKGFTDEEDEGDGEVGDDEDEDDGEGEGRDKEKGSEIDDGHTETSGNSDESKSKHRKSARKGKGKGSGSSKCLPPKSRAIPLVRPTSNSHNAMGQGQGQGQGGVETQRDTSNYLIAGSPLQSMSAYNLDQDQLSSYQKRWIHDRDRDRDLVGSISRSGSAQSLPHSAQKSSSPAPHATAAQSFVSMTAPAPAPASSRQLESRDVRSLEDVEGGRGSEEGTRQSGPETYKDLVSPSRDRTQPASLPQSISSSASYRRSSNLSSNLAQSADSGKESPSDEGQGQGQGRYHALIGEQQQHPPPLNRTATRTQSMSQLLSSASSLNPNSILSAVWSSQERRRERVKLLAAGEKATNGDGDRRSKSYNSLSAACIPIIAEASTLKDIHALLEIEESKRNDLTSRSQLFDSPKRAYPHGRGAASGLFDGTDQVKNANTDLEPTEYLILDFTEVLGIDATSARSCFLMLVRSRHLPHLILVKSDLCSESSTLPRHG